MNRQLRSRLSVGVVMLYVLSHIVGGRTLIAQQTVAATRSSADDTHEADEALARKISISLTHVTRAEAIDSVSQLAKVFIQYRGRVLDGDPTRINVHATDLPLGTVLEQILEGTGLVIQAGGAGKLTLVSATATNGRDSTTAGTITGRIIDSVTGRGIPGATVKVDGTKLTAVVLDSGRFTLKDVPAGDMIVTARAFGYKPSHRTVTVTSGTSSSIRILLPPAPNVLSGVVTTATGQQRKVEVGSDITTLNADSILRVTPILSVTDLLATRVPGLTIVHSSGVPGAPARLRLRGAGSIEYNNDPIIIVDGIRAYSSQSDPRNNNLAAPGYSAPSPLDQIDPNSIETIEVLKGPSATATYGSDAANGVIVVTTKRGQAGPTNWSLTAGSGMNWLPGKWPTNYYRFGHDGNSAAALGQCTWNDLSCITDSIVPFQALNQSQYSVFDHGSMHDASLSVSGGSPTLIYSLTGTGSTNLGYLKLPGSEQARYTSLYGPIPSSLVHPDRNATWGVGGSLTAQPYSMTHITLQSSLFSDQQRQSSLAGAINQLQGAYITPLLQTGPLIASEFERVTDNQLTSKNSVALDWQPRPWLPINATGGINTIQRTDESYVPFGVCDVQLVFCASGDTTGFYALGRGISRDQSLNVGTIIPFFQRKITIAAGGNMYSESANEFSTYTDQLAPGVSTPTSFTTLNNGVLTNSPTSQGSTTQSTYGWYVEPRLNVASRFFFTPGFRLDGGSGASQSAGSLGGLSAFPKMDFSYVAVDRQAGHPLWGFLTMLRPRLAFGLAGTQPSPADKLRLYNVGSYSLVIPGQGNLAISGRCNETLTLDGTTTVPAVCLNTLGNTLLRPERSSEVEGGADITVWDGLLQLTYSMYNKTRHDAIMSVPVAPSVYTIGDAITSVQKNIGVIRNTGTELTATLNLIQRQALGWTINTNYSHNKSLVVRLNQGDSPIILDRGSDSYGIQSRVQGGYPIFAEFARPIVGFSDANGNGIIEQSEVRYGDSALYVGQPDPKYQLNFSNDIALFNGRLGIHATFAYQDGMTQVNEGACTSGALAFIPNSPSSTLATQAAIVSLDCGLSLSTATGIGLVQTVNTFRFNSLSVNYNVSPRMSSWLHVPRMTVALQGSNLALHTNYRGADPDVNAFATVSAGDQTRDTGLIPEPRTWSLRIMLGK